VHEWWGMNDAIQAKGALLSLDGQFTVLVADMYRGKVGLDRETAGHLKKGLNWSGAVQDISAGAKYLKELGCTMVGVTGFCMGGALALSAALRCPEISAASAFYGIPGEEEGDLTNIKIPIQGHFGELDQAKGFSSPDDYNALKEKLLANNVGFEMYTYHAGHSFTSPAAETYDQVATELSFSRLYEFMKKHLS